MEGLAGVPIYKARVLISNGYVSKNVLLSGSRGERGWRRSGMGLVVFRFPNDDISRGSYVSNHPAMRKQA